MVDTPEQVRYRGATRGTVVTIENTEHPGDRECLGQTEGERRASELIQRELACCCVDFALLQRNGRLSTQSPLARAIEMLRPSHGLMARRRAVGLMNRYARQAVAAGHADRAADEVVFCLDCAWTGDYGETADGDCPECREDGFPGRLRAGDGNPLEFLAGVCAGAAR